MTVEYYPKDLHCGYCGTSICFDDKRVSSRTGKKYPLDPQTGARHQCQEYYDAMKEKVAEQVKKEYAAYRLRSKENARKFKRERFAIRKNKKRLVERKRSDAAISINENPTDEHLLIEYRPPDYREW